MISKERTKHAKLTRPALGRFGRNEWAFTGTHCSAIQGLARQLIAAFQDRYRCAYLDADHAGADASPALPGMLASGASWEYTDAIHSHRLQANANWGIHQFRQLFQEADMVFVNGNHHEAAAQIVIIDPAKENSLRKRLGQLSNVRLILLTENATQVFDFLQDTLPDYANIPQLKWNDTAAIIRFFTQEMERALPPVKGLVLAGGRSVRMGRDKGAISWHGKPQREYMGDLLRSLCNEVYISCRAGQENELESAYPALPDTFAELGPYGAILSAFRAEPDTAWLVVACDLPLLDRPALEFLLQNRQPARIATAFQSPVDQLPEPLISIWEPKSYPVLLSFLAQGYSCPRKVLIQSDTCILQAPDPAVLTNVNTPEELGRIALP